MSPATLEQVRALIAPLEARIAVLEGVPIVKENIEVAFIQQIVADHFKLPLSAMRSKGRPDVIARPRQIAMYFSMMFTILSPNDIGKDFGGRDRGTVNHARKAVESMIEMEPHMRDSINHLRGLLAAKIQ